MLFSFSACSNKDNVEKSFEATVDETDINENIPYLGPINVSYDLSTFVDKENDPSVKKAQISVLFSTNICRHTRLLINNENYPIQTLESYEDFYNYLDFKDVTKEEVYSSNGVDINDFSILHMGHREIRHNKKNYDVLFCTVLDSSVVAGWESNFHVGYDSDDYYDKTGQHSDWTEKENHKGFDVTANRCIPVIENYISSKLNKKSQQILYIFGHSRGGAVSNLIAKKLIDKNYDVTAYTSASPLTTTSSNTGDSKYNRIFNYINSRDVVTCVPPASIGFKRYGQDIVFDINDYQDSFKRLMGREFSIDKDNTATVSLLSSLADSRAKLYEFDTKFTISTSLGLKDEAAVERYINEQKEKFSNQFEPLRSFLRFDITTNSDNKFIVNVVSCPAFLMHLIGTGIATYGIESNSLKSLALQYYSVLSAYAKILGYSDPTKMIDLIDVDSVIDGHAYQSYLAYYFA